MEHNPGDGHKAQKDTIEQNKVCRGKKANADPSDPYNAPNPCTSDKKQSKIKDKLQSLMMTDLIIYNNEVDYLIST